MIDSEALGAWMAAERSDRRLQRVFDRVTADLCRPKADRRGRVEPFPGAIGAGSEIQLIANALREVDLIDAALGPRSRSSDRVLWCLEDILARRRLRQSPELLWQAPLPHTVCRLTFNHPNEDTTKHV